MKEKIKDIAIETIIMIIIATVLQVIVTKISGTAYENIPYAVIGMTLGYWVGRWIVKRIGIEC